MSQKHTQIFFFSVRGRAAESPWQPSVKCLNFKFQLYFELEYRGAECQLRLCRVEGLVVHVQVERQSFFFFSQKKGRSARLCVFFTQ